MTNENFLWQLVWTRGVRKWCAENPRRSVQVGCSDASVCSGVVLLRLHNDNPARRHSGCEVISDLNYLFIYYCPQKRRQYCFPVLSPSRFLCQHGNSRTAVLSSMKFARTCVLAQVRVCKILIVIGIDIRIRNRIFRRVTSMLYSASMTRLSFVCRLSVTDVLWLNGAR